MREPGPGRLLPGLVQLFFRASFLAAALVTPPGGMGRVKLTAPAAAMAASANELDADGWRPIIGGGEGRPASGYGCSCCTGSPSRRATGGVASQAPIRRPAGAQAGRHDHVSGDRAAQSANQARRGGLWLYGERARDWQFLPA